MALRQDGTIIAGELVTSIGVSREIWTPWQSYFLTASPRSISASIRAYDLSGSLAVLQYQSTTNASPLWTVQPTPQDLALAAPAAGSGQLIVDWSNTDTATACATFAASVVWIPSGSAIGDTGTCTLGTACTTLYGTTASEWQSASLLQFTTPPSRGGWLTTRLICNTGDPQTTACTVLIGTRLRYYVDRLGS